MTKRNQILLTILIALLLILGIMVTLVVYAARNQDPDEVSDAKEETTLSKEDDEAKDKNEAQGKEDAAESEDDDPSTVPDAFIGNYEGEIKWPPGRDGELTKIEVTFTENSTTLTTGRDSRALKVNVDEKQTEKKRIYTEAPILQHGAKNVTWTFSPSDDGMDVSYSTQGTSRVDAHLAPTD